jgi:hypothetical protein
MEKLEKMVSQQCYDEICAKVKAQVGEQAFDYIFPAVKKALEEGGIETRNQILSRWLDIGSCRVCDECGAIMEEGWYNCGKYACSDECVCKQDGITKEEFDRFQIYKTTIQGYLDDEKKGRKAEKLTDEEIAEIMNEIFDDCDAYYTSWR